MATIEVGTGKEYTSLQAAINAASTGDTIVLTESISEASISIDGKDIAIDLGGFTFTGKTYIKNGADAVISNGKMTVAGNSPAFGDAVIKVTDGEVEVDGVKTVVPTSLELNGVEIDGGEAINSRYYTDAVNYNATGGLKVTDCTITAGMATRNADCESIGTFSSGAVGIYAPNKSGGKIEITNSTINGGYGKTDAEWTGFVAQLFANGGYGISLHGTSEVTITDSTVNGGGSNWYNAGYAINVSNQFSGTLDVADSAVNGGNAEGQVGNYGQGGSGIYTNMSTSCESIDITGSTITGGAGGKSSNAFGIEYRNEDIKMNITESTVAAGNGADASGGGAAIAIYNSDSTQIVLSDVKLNGEGNGSNTVIKGGDKGITVVGPVEVTGGELENTKITVDAEDFTGTQEVISGATGEGVSVEVSGNDDAVVIVDGGKTYVTTETDPADADTSIIYVNNNWDGKEANAMVGVGKFIGVNAFADVNAAEAVAEAGAEKMVIEDGAEVVYNKDPYYFLNTNPNEGGENNAFDNVVDADKTYDLDVNGTLKSYQVLMNNAVTTVSKTGKLLASGEALRIMGGSITVEGNRAADAGVPAEIYTGRWGGGVSAGADTQLQGGYFMVNQEAVANFSDTVILVHAGAFNVDNANADFSNTYIYLGDGGGYGAVNVSFTNGAEVTFADNTTMVYDKTYTITPAMNITVDGTSSFTMDASSSITATTLTVADGGKFIINAANFSGYKKVVDLAGTESLEGKVTIEGEGVTAIYGEDGDVTLSTVSLKTVFVNAEYTGEVGADLGNGKFFGVNAFADFESALRVACTNSSVSRIEIESDLVDPNIEYTQYNDIAQKLTIGATVGKNFTVDLGAHSSSVDSVAIRVMGDGASLTIEEGVKFVGLDVVAAGFATTNEEIIINGEVQALSLKVWTNNNGITVNETGKVTLGYGDGQLDLAYGNGSLTVNGTLTDTADTSLTDGPQFRAGYSGTRGNGNTINLNNTYFEGGAWFTVNSSNGAINMDNSVLKVSGGDGAGSLTMGSSGNKINVDNGSRLIVANVTVGADNKIAVDGGALEISTLTNNGAVEVSGESTLNVATLTGNTIDLMDGAIVKDSTVGGGVFVAGNVTFRGDNTFGMITDFGTLTDYYGTTAPMAWTVEAGASVTLSNKARYGLGYGDKVVVNGEIAENGAAAARATLTDDDSTNDVKQSLFMHGLVAQESAGWNCDSSFTVNNAFVTIGSNSSFGSKAGNYGGNYTFSFNNSVLNASRITFYNTNAKTIFNLKNSDVEIGQFMTRDQDSVFTLDNTNFVSTGTINGNDEGQYNGGTLNVTNGSKLTYSSTMTNEATGIINVENGTLVAPGVINNGTINVSGEAAIITDNYTGDGWIYMNGATVDSQTKLVGANVRFASGENVVDGATINKGRFQVGTGLYQTVDPKVDSENGVTVTVQNNAHIGGIDTSDVGAPYGGWVGSAYYDKVEDKLNAMTDARYTLNINNSIAEFGYMHVSHDGILNVTGNADEKASYTGVDYSYYSGFFNVNGVATFDNVDVLTLFVNVSSDNDTENPGKLVIKNGTNFVSWRDSSTAADTFKISKTGVVEVDNATLVSRHGTVIAADAALNVKNGGAFKGYVVTNNGTITIDGLSTFTATTLTSNGTITIDASNFAGGVKKIIDLSGTESLAGKVTIVGEGISAVYEADGDVSITDATTDTLYVDAAWAGKKLGESVGEGKVFGFNAFASSKDALGKANELGGATINVDGMGDDNDEAASNNGGSLLQLTPGTYTITGGKGASSKLYGIKFSDGVNVVFDKAFLATGKLGDGASGSLSVKDSVVGSLGDEAFAGARGWFTYKNTAVKIENSIFGMRSSDFGDAALDLPRSAEEVKAAIAAGTYTHPAYGKNHSGANFGTLGTVDVDDSTMYTGYLSVVDRALMTLDNSVLYYGGTFSIGAGEVTGYTNRAYYGWDVQHSELSWVKPPHASAEGYREGLAAQVDITDSILYNVGYGDGSASHGGTALQVGGYFNDKDYKGVLNITRSEVNLGQGDADAVHSILDITANGTVNMTDSSLVAEKVVNAGTFTVSGNTTINIDTLSGNYLRFEDSAIVGDSVVGGNIRTFGNFEVAADFTTKQSNFYGTTTIKSGAVYTGSTTIVGGGSEFTLENGAELQSRFFNVVGGTADIAGKLVLDHSDPRQKLLQIHEDGVANINEGAAVTINRHNAIVNAGGTLNVNGGSLTITADTVNVAPERGGVIYNAGTVNVNDGLVDIKTLSNTSEVVVNGGKLDAENMDLLGNFKLTGLTAGEARTITVAFVPAGETDGGFTKQLTVGKNATSIDINFTDVADGKYDLTVIDGTSVKTATTEIINGTLDINGGKVVLDALNVNSGAANVYGESTVVIEKQSGVVKVNDGAVLTDSKLGTVYAYGNSEWKGTNTIKAFSLGWYNSGADIEVSMSGTANVDNFMLGNSEGFTSTLNIGSADSERTTVNGNQHNYTTNSVVNVVNADVTGNYASMTGVVNVTDSTYSGFGDFRVVAGGKHTIDPKVKFDNSSISGAYGYIGGWSATAGGYGVLELVNNSTWKSSGGSCATATSTITLDNSDMIIGGTFTMYGKLTMDVDSMIAFKGIDLGTTGSITIDMAAIDTASGNKLFDRKDAGWTVDNYKALISNWDSSMDKFFTVDAEGDLIVKANAVAYVNGEYTDASKNQFATHEEAIASGAVRIITTGGTVQSMIGFNGIESVITGGSFAGTVSGGAVTSGDYKDWKSVEGDANMTISGGSFDKMVIGGERVNSGSTERIGDINLNISGGTFNTNVVGGMLYADRSIKGQALLVGNVNMTISGGEFHKFIYGGNITANATYANRTAIEGDVNITIDATGDNTMSFLDTANIYAGSYRSGAIIGNVQVTFSGLGENITWGDRIQVWGGCSGDYYDMESGDFFSSISGSRTFTFDAFSGDFGATIGGFETLEVVNDTDVNMLKGTLSAVENWVFEADSSLSGSFVNDFAGDMLNIELGDWDGADTILMSGAESTFAGIEDLAGVTVGSDALTFDGVSKWANASYELEFKTDETDSNKKVLAFSKLA